MGAILVGMLFASKRVDGYVTLPPILENLSTLSRQKQIPSNIAIK